MIETIYECAKWIILTIATIVISGFFITLCLFFLEWIASKGNKE